MEDVENVKAKGRRFARPEYVTCYLALAAVLLSHQPVMGISKRSVADERPRLIIHPLPQNDTDSKLIWYRANDPTSYKAWVDDLNRLTEEYYLPGLITEGSLDVQKCDYEHPPSEGKVCDVDVRSWGPCSKENNYHYNTSTPCVFLKLSQIPGWAPDYYSRRSDFPAAMPSYLQDYIAVAAGNHSTRLNTIWITCDGVNPADVENVGPILYYPTQGFPGFFYPYENIAGYRSPIIAIKFKRPNTGVLINIECKVWARNINRDQHEESVHFELMID